MRSNTGGPNSTTCLKCARARTKPPVRTFTTTRTLSDVNTKRGSYQSMKLRTDWAHRITLAAEAGQPIRCRRCDKPVLPSMTWDLGHHLDQATHGPNAIALAPEHAKCNRSAGGKLRHQLRAPLRPSRSW